MTPDELEQQINELEYNLERLRSLYEQYFLGIEKIEPQVARKDVDRRFWVLRKIQIRNTARRFKLQTLIQRYNTYQQYWQRICREIENGTYKRQLQRAERRFGPSASLSGEPTFDEAQAPEQEAARTQSASQAKRAAEDDLASLLQASIDGSLDLAAETQRALDAVLSDSGRREPKPAKLTSSTNAAASGQSNAERPKPKALSLDALELDDFDFGGGSATPAPSKPAVARPQVAKPISTVKPALPQRAAPAQAAKASARIEPNLRSEPNLVSRPSSPRPSQTGGISDTQVQQLHAKLMATKQQLNDSKTVSAAALRKQLEASYEQLKTKHQGRQVEFDIGVKDGRAVVKAKLR